MATNGVVPGGSERKGTFKVEFLKDIERRMQTRYLYIRPFYIGGYFKTIYCDNMIFAKVWQVVSMCEFLQLVLNVGLCLGDSFKVQPDIL